MRHQARSYALQALYQAELLQSKSMVHCDRFLGQLETQEETRVFARELIAGTLKHRKHIDRRLRRNLDRWKLNRLSVVVRNILRLAAFELCFQGQLTHQVVINEAIELCKDFVDDSSHGLINSVLQKLHDEDAAETPKAEDQPKPGPTQTDPPPAGAPAEEHAQVELSSDLPDVEGDSTGPELPNSS